MASPKEDSEGSDDRGCLFIIGLIIIGVCIGNIYTAAAGWLVIGVGLVICALLPSKGTT